MAAVSVDVVGVAKSFGTTEVLRTVDLAVGAGEIVALLGPSGCGKTTLLRTIAGLERPDAGEVHLDGRSVASSATWLAPERRRIGMVFQDWALFPHMDVAANVAYGLRGRDRGDVATEVAAALDMVGLDRLGARMPSMLSGGQQQRVALARALAPRPSAILLDEPFSNLDTALRVHVRAEVRRLLVDLGITSVFVTHDQSEAFIMGDRVAVMAEGTIAQLGTPAELYERPASPWVAGFVGEANLLDGEASGGKARTACGTVRLAQTAEGAVSVLARPEELVLAGSDRGAAGAVAVVEYHGHDTVYLVDLDAGPSVRTREASAPRWKAGDRVTVHHSDRPAVAWPSGSGKG